MARDMKVSEKTIQKHCEKWFEDAAFENANESASNRSPKRKKAGLSNNSPPESENMYAHEQEPLFWWEVVTVKAICNRQNNRVLAKLSADIPDSASSIFRRQKPSSVMVWASISKT